MRRIPAPAGLAHDLSAEMAFVHLGAHPTTHPPQWSPTTTSTNHFDRGGLVSIFALIEPASALPHRDLLIDVAAAGDVATCRDRRAALAAMAMACRGAAEATCGSSEF